MNTTPIYQVDAFTNTLFGGNPAAVMPLDQWLPDERMQAIALENNLSETAFLVPLPESDPADFHIRWFTPAVEVPLCGHATLASAWVVFNRLSWSADTVHFHSRSGPLAVTRRAEGWLELDFPNLPFEHRPTPALILEALPGAPAESFYVPNDTNYMVVLGSEGITLRIDWFFLLKFVLTVAVMIFAWWRWRSLGTGRAVVGCACLSPGVKSLK